jgi:hypothetical protein
MKTRCCPNTPRSIYEAARDRAREIATTDAYVVSRRERKKIEMLFASEAVDPGAVERPCLGTGL